MMDLQFLPAQEDDVASILAQAKMLIDRYEDTAIVDYPKIIVWLERKIKENLDQYVRVSRDNQTVAYYRFVSGQDTAELDDLYVLPGYRGEGIGTAILEKCFCESCQPITLYVFTENEGAMRFYFRNGFSFFEQVSQTRCILQRCT